MNRKGFIDGEVLGSPFFVILMLFALSATAIGYIGGKKMGLDSFPIWQLVLMLIGEIVACYIITARNM